MVLDVCVKLPATFEQLADAVRRTSQWARRSADARSSETTAVFGIVQGGLQSSLRERSVRELVALDFPGYAIGGLSVGETREELYTCARFTAELLPERQAALSYGGWHGARLTASDHAGVDLFDCVYPTRCGRNGRAMTHDGELNIFNATFTTDFGPLDAQCGCSTCTA